MALKLLDQVDGAFKDAVIQQKEDVVQATASVTVDPAVLAPGVAQMVGRIMESERRAQAANNLRQIALAMHNFQAVYNSLPPAAIYDRNGKPLLSWRVQLLPFLEQDRLYKEFHLDEPWDSPNNKKLLDRMPRVFASPSQGKSHFTAYQVFVGKGTVFEGKKGISLVNIPDGTSNTILAVETLPAVPWTKPEDIPFDVDRPLPKLGGFHEGGFWATMCDGSARFIKSTVPEKTLKIAIGRNDGQVLPKDF